MKVDYKDILIRSVKTFFQSFLSSLSIGLIAINDWSSLKALLFASSIAGCSALISLAQNWIKSTM